MREIEFKVWIPEKEKMYKNAYLLLDDIFSYDEEEDEESLVACVTEGRVVPMGILLQYTGLKDKDGKKIFEGDILQLAEPKICPCCDQYDKLRTVGKYRIEWTQEMVEYECLEIGGDNFMSPPAWNEMIIIGNRFENPELLGE